MRKAPPFLIVLSILFINCKNNEIKSSEISTSTNDTLRVTGDFPSKMVEQLDKLPNIRMKIGDIVLPNDQTVKEYLRAKVRELFARKTMDIFISIPDRALALPIE